MIDPHVIWLFDKQQRIKLQSIINSRTSLPNQSPERMDYRRSAPVFATTSIAHHSRRKLGTHTARFRWPSMSFDLRQSTAACSPIQFRRTPGNGEAVANKAVDCTLKCAPPPCIQSIATIPAGLL